MVHLLYTNKCKCTPGKTCRYGHLGKTLSQSHARRNSVLPSVAVEKHMAQDAHKNLSLKVHDSLTEDRRLGCIIS